MGFQFFPPPVPRHLSHAVWQTACLGSGWPLAAKLRKHDAVMRIGHTCIEKHRVTRSSPQGLHLSDEIRATPMLPDALRREIAGRGVQDRSASLLGDTSQDELGVLPK